MLVGVAKQQFSAFEAWLAWPGIIIGLFLNVGSLEFVGRFDEQGWKFLARSSRSPTSPAMAAPLGASY